MPAVTVHVQQVDTKASQGVVRENHKMMIDRPESKGGSDAGAMGGELLLVSLGGCFMSNLLEAIRTREAAISNVNIAVTGTLEGAPAHFTAMEMAITADYEDRAQIEKLVTISERSCIDANTLKGSVDLSINIA